MGEGGRRSGQGRGGGVWGKGGGVDGCADPHFAALNYPHELIVPDERSQIAICYAIQKKAPLEIIQ